MVAGHYVDKNLKEYIYGMGYPSHFHEIERSFAGIWERNVRGVIRLVTV